MKKQKIKGLNLPSKKPNKLSGKNRDNLPSKRKIKTAANANADYSDVFQWQFDEKSGQVYMNIWCGGSVRIINDLITKF